MRAWLRVLTPLGWAVAVVAILLALGGLGLRWDPLGLQQRRLEAAQARARAGVAEAHARWAETKGAEAQMGRLDDFHQRTAAAERAATVVQQQARSADDAYDLLESDRADRLRRHDGELCRLAPDLDGCAAAPDVAGSGDAAMRPGGPAA